MLLSRLFAKTSKEAQADATSVNANLLLRGGFIHKEMAGVYSFLPLGWRVLRKIEQILREEMDPIGQEVFLSSLSPKENWEKTGRLETVDVLFQATPGNTESMQKHDASYVLNSTHEEVITPILARYVSSYKDLPCAAYQIQTKFRNEARPKSGIMRGREFRMKDLYSFHTTEEDMLEYFHQKATPAYEAFFKRIGLGDKTIITLASGGDFSKEYSREFQTICPTGEDHVFYSPRSGIAYNREIAPKIARPWNNDHEAEKPRAEVMGKGIIGVEELASYLHIEVQRTTKTMLFEDENGQVIAAAVRGDYEVNEEKLRKILKVSSLQLASPQTVQRVTGAEVGYAGPLDLPPEVRILWDNSTANRKNFECGANKTDYHSININFGRDLLQPETFYDIATAQEGDIEPESGEVYQTFRAAEVGNIFTLYTKFSSAFHLQYTDHSGKEQPVYMGCYGIGTSRVMGVIVELHHDDKGIIWPESIAPAQYHIIPIAKDEKDETFIQAKEIYDLYTQQGIECLFDDRLSLSVGNRLADADLIGVPTRLILSPKTLAQNSAEVKRRSEEESQLIPLEKLKHTIT